MRIVIFVAALTLLALPMAVGGQTPTVVDPASDTEVTVVGKQPKKKRVCQSYVPTGSIRLQKICRTQVEIDDEHDRSMIELARLRDRQTRNWQMRQTCKMAEKC
jgi:hypothetical protein